MLIEKDFEKIQLNFEKTQRRIHGLLIRRWNQSYCRKNYESTTNKASYNGTVVQIMTQVNFKIKIRALSPDIPIYNQFK